MPFAGLSRPLSLCLALSASASLGFSNVAQAEFIYGRLVPEGGEANGDSSAVDVSSDGRTVVFSSAATNWAPLGAEYNGNRAVAVDLDSGIVEVVSVPPGGSVFRGETPVVSGDGRYVAFLTLNASYGPNWQVLRKDRQTGALELASSDSAGQPASTGTNDNTVSISADGRYVAFQANADMTGLAARPAGDAAPSGSSGEIYVKDMTAGQVEMASVSSGGTASGSNCSLQPHALSGTGRYLTMLCSDAMVPGATSGQAYVRDLQANTTELVSRSASAPSGSSSFAYRPAISPNGRFVSLQNRGYGGLGYADGVSSEGNSGVYLHDRQAQTTVAIPRPTAIPADSYDSCYTNAVSDIGSVLLTCPLDIGQPSSVSQVFLYVPGAGAPELLSATAGSQPGNGQSGYSLAVNASGLSMTFESDASNIDPDDSNGKSDIFVLIDSSLLTDVIFADGFQTPPQLRQEQGGRFHAVPVAPEPHSGSAPRR